jgi:hypothetical protein
VSGAAGGAVSGVAGVAVSGAAAHAGERAAFAKLHDLADERRNLTNCPVRASPPAGSSGHIPEAPAVQTGVKSALEAAVVRVKP